MSIVNQYFSTFPSCQYVFKSGKIAHFIGGVYRTAVKSEVEELDFEIAENHPNIYVTAERTVDTTKLDPIAALKEKIIADYIATQNKALDPANDRGTEDAAPIKPAGMQTSSGSITMAAKSNSK